jgi:hypothetical protein
MKTLPRMLQKGQFSDWPTSGSDQPACLHSPYRAFPQEFKNVSYRAAPRLSL